MSIVALFVDPTKDEVSEVLDSGLIDLIQFHGNESEEFCSSFDTPYMKALHIKDQFYLYQFLTNIRVHDIYF